MFGHHQFWPWSRLAVQITLVIFLVVAVSGLVSYTRVSATMGQRSEAGFGDIVRRRATQVHDQLEQSARLVLADVSLLGSGQRSSEVIAARGPDATKLGLTLTGELPADPVYGWVDANRIR